MRNIAITGINGFIGSHLARAFLAKGYRVKGLVRHSSDLHSLQGLDIDLVKGDITDPFSLEQLFKGCDTVFHVAGTFAYWGLSAQDFMHTSEKGMETVLKAALTEGVSRVIVTSSSVTMGASAVKMVLDENNIGKFDDAPPYVLAKCAQEKYAFEWAQQYPVEVLAVCPTLTVGGPDYGLTESNRMIINYLRDPFRTSWIGGCNIVSVDDIVAAHILVAKKGQAGERYLAGGENMEWKDVHRLIGQLAGVGGPNVVAYHTSAYLAAAFNEWVSYFTKEPPSSSRDQARMVGKYYWYDHTKLAALGYTPQPVRQALIAAISWLTMSNHLSAAQRALLHFDEDIYTFRKKHFSL